MEEEVKFTREDYVQSITRIFDINGNVVGTGFLVASGYVLTCAHVVLQAIGKKRKEFDCSEGIPSNLIELDFPILAYGKKIKAIVEDRWLPYSMSQGDAAGLKLLQVQPSEAKPVPLIHVNFSDIEDDEHSVYGFGNASGEQSDAYKPKTLSTGGRFQFYKAGNPHDETIKEGFSGAPVWNEHKKCVIGMIATAQVFDVDFRSKAYVIPKKALDSVLKQISASSLNELIEKHLKQLPKNQKWKLSSAISNAFHLCDSGSVWIEKNEKNRLEKKLLSLSQLGERGWNGVDRLTQWTVFLSTMDVVPIQMYRECKNWIEDRGFNFDKLLGRAMLEKRERQDSSVYISEHLVVKVRPDEGEEENVCISIWAIGDRTTYDPKESPRSLLKEKRLTPLVELQ